MELLMNKRTLKKALLHVSNGRSFQQTGQFVDVEWRLLRNELLGMGVTDEQTARKKLRSIKAKELILHLNDKSNKNAGDFVPAFKPELVESKNNFDRASAIVNDKQTTKERIPLAEQKEFRRDLKDRPWVQILKKWCEKYGLSEDDLMEQAVL